MSDLTRLAISPTPHLTGFQPAHNGFGVPAEYHQFRGISQAPHVEAIYPPLPGTIEPRQLLVAEYFDEAADLALLFAHEPLLESGEEWGYGAPENVPPSVDVNIHEGGASATGPPQQVKHGKPKPPRKSSTKPHSQPKSKTPPKPKQTPKPKRPRAPKDPNIIYKCPVPGCGKNKYTTKSGWEYHNNVSAAFNVTCLTEY